MNRSEARQRSRRASRFAARTGRALLETIAVLIVAALAAAATLLAFRYFHVDGPAMPWFAAAFVTVAMVTLYLLHRGTRSSSVEDLNARLTSKPRAKAEYAKLALYLQLDPKIFADHCERMADTGEDIMLICREGREKKLYDTDKIAEQLQTLSASPLRQRVKWAVFTANDNKFVAFQDFEIFLVQFLGTWSGTYRSALNEIEPAKFRNALEEMSRQQAEAAMAPGQPYMRVPNADLQFRSLDRGASRQDMIHYLIDNRIGEAMLVKHEKPVGVISLADLVDGAFGPMLTKGSAIAAE